MDLFIVTGLLILSSYAKGNNSQNDSSLEVNNSNSGEIPPSFTTADFFETPVPTFKETDETEDESQQGSSGTPWNYDGPVRSTTVEGSSESVIFSHLSKLTGKIQKDRKNHEGYEESFGRENPELNQPPARREVPSAWGQPEDISAGTLPSNYYLYYPYDVRYLQADYIDYPAVELDQVDEKNGSLSPRVVQESGSRQEPQYYQKNYYYNYYPMASRRNSAPTRWKNDERGLMEDPNKRGTNNRRYYNANPCRQYLEFLRYAFEKLDEQSDYNYDYPEEQWSDKLGQGNQHVFTTQMMGPTLYIDNSGNIAQMNAKENTIQSYDIYSAVPNAQRNPSADLRPSTPFKSSSPSSVYTPKQYTKGYSLPQTPSSTPKPNLHQPTTEKWGKSSVKIVTNSPSTKTVTRVPSTSPKPEERFEDDYKYSYPESKSTTGATPTHWPSSENNYNTIDSSSERTTEHTTTTGYVVNNASYGVGAPYNLVISSTTQPPTRIPIPYTTEVTNRFDDTTSKKKDVDCDDQLLPCPDTLNITYPLNGYCNKYVTCESGRATRRTCPDGLHFNIITKSCDLPHNSFCTYVCPQPNGYFGIPGDCGGYFVCKKSVPEYRMCPPHMHWNIEKRSCSFLEFSNCPMKCSSTNEVKPYEGDCKAYVICLSGIAYYHKCPPNTKFDKTTLTCIAANTSKCEDDPRLLTKTVNPNVLCRDIELKVGAKTWCSFFEANKQRIYTP